MAQSVANCMIPDSWQHVFIALQIFVTVLLFVTLVNPSIGKTSRLVTALIIQLGAKGIFFNVYL